MEHDLLGFLKELSALCHKHKFDIRTCPYNPVINVDKILPCPSKDSEVGIGFDGLVSLDELIDTMEYIDELHRDQ